MVTCEACCRNCCYSTPLVTLGAVFLAAFGLLGFTASAIYGLAVLDTVPHLQNGTVVLAPVVSGAVILTLIPLLFAVIISYCTTGYIRDVCFSSAVKNCIKPCCNIFVITLVLLYILFWLLLVIGFSGLMVYYIQAELVCSEFESTSGSGGMEICFAYVDESFNYFEICRGDGLEELCSDGLDVGLAFSVSLVFALIVVVGMAILLIVLSTNMVSAKDNLEYRKANSPRNDAYFSKRVR